MNLSGEEAGQHGISLFHKHLEKLRVPGGTNQASTAGEGGGRGQMWLILLKKVMFSLLVNSRWWKKLLLHPSRVCGSLGWGLGSLCWGSSPPYVWG